MHQRCTGRVPRALRIDRRDERERPMGKCPICGVWMSVMSNGLLHPHINRLRRRPARHGEGWIDGAA